MKICALQKSDYSVSVLRKKKRRKETLNMYQKTPVIEVHVHVGLQLTILFCNDPKN